MNYENNSFQTAALKVFLLELAHYNKLQWTKYRRANYKHDILIKLA